MGLAKKILTQRTATKGKIYSVHAPEVHCIAKGKVHKKYEFGNKVSVATTTKGNWVVGLHSLLGNPFASAAAFVHRAAPNGCPRPPPSSVAAGGA
jgi:hypothetical protein